MTPIVYQLSQSPLLNAKAALYTLMLAGSHDFSTPFGYQTNLMVTGVAGYHYIDFLKMGIPLQIITCISTVIMVHTIFL